MTEKLGGQARQVDDVYTQLIVTKEAEARLKHGWVTVNTGEAIVDAGK